MPTIRQLARLFQAVSSKDLISAEQIAKQIANLEEKKGHRSAAQLLRGSLQSNGIKGHRVPEQISGVVANGNFLEAALSKGLSPTRLADVMLRPACRRALETFINETRHGAYFGVLKGYGVGASSYSLVRQVAAKALLPKQSQMN